ncbi:MAG: hypothetical protein IKL91_04995, partial [Bacteroidales bacterium]|nr:hypothetical protein [Bacteroidales bacterium]
QAYANTSYVVNNVAKYEGSSKRGLANAGTRKYNLTNAESADGDTNYGDYGNLTMSWTNETNMLTWALNETITIAKHATANEISTDISTKFEDFDIWLKTVEEKPYEIDFYGNERNPEKLNPGAWDPGL